MPFRSSVTNRKLMRQARKTLAALPPKERDALHWNGIGPGDSYIGMWRIVTQYRHRLREIQIGLSNPNIKPATKRDLEKDWRYLMEQIVKLYSTVLPYEKAKLSAITISGDPTNPMHVEHDLSHLTDGELRALARILPKLGGVTGPRPDAGDFSEDAKTRLRARRSA
jgi:hypothetical protein